MIHLTHANFFPYETYRKEQQDIIRLIELNARLRKNILLVAPNGAGKTIMALSALLPVAIEQDLKIIYLCRTHTQASRVIRELRKIAKTQTKGLTGLALRGRSHSCLKSPKSEYNLNPLKLMDMCQQLRANNSCQYFEELYNKQFSFEFPNYPLDGEHILEIAKNKGCCPYYLSLKLLKLTRIVVCSYQWILNPQLRSYFLRYLGAFLEHCILVIDECHNVIDLATRETSYSLTLPFLIECLENIPKMSNPIRQTYGQLLCILIKHLRRKKRQLTLGDTETQPIEFLKLISKELHFDIIEFNSFLNQLLKMVRINNISENFEAFNYMRYVAKFWERFIDIYTGKYFFCYHISPKSPTKKKSISLEIVSIDPREGTLEVFSNSYSCINLTGTINPYIYSKLTGLNGKKTGYMEIIASSPFDSKNIKALIVEGVSTKKKDRTPGMYRKLIGKITEVVCCTPANVGIFCASYIVLSALLVNGISEALKPYGKDLFIERPNLSASANALILKEFKELSKVKNKGAILLGVCGGRNSEGESYPGDYMNAVIIVGIPYHSPTLRTKAKIAYFDKVFHNQGWLFAYLSPAMHRANQAAGRPIRKEQDKGAIIFLDSRFKNQVKWISDWIQKEVRFVPDRKNEITNNLKMFWKERNY